MKIIHTGLRAKDSPHALTFQGPILQLSAAHFDSLGSN
jgi:hypothetical protein